EIFPKAWLVLQALCCWKHELGKPGRAQSSFVVLPCKPPSSSPSHVSNIVSCISWLSRFPRVEHIFNDSLDGVGTPVPSCRGHSNVPSCGLYTNACRRRNKLPPILVYIVSFGRVIQRYCLQLSFFFSDGFVPRCCVTSSASSSTPHAPCSLGHAIFSFTPEPPSR
ncbi:unnamed protein product, partial [Ectocarpus sp. 8 AP-2014]